MSNSSKLLSMLEIPATLVIDSLGEHCRPIYMNSLSWDTLSLLLMMINVYLFGCSKDFMGLMLFELILLLQLIL